MNSRERLLKALNHEKPDFVPNSPRLWAWMIEYYGTMGPAAVIKAADEFDFDPTIQVGLGVPDLVAGQLNDSFHFLKYFPEVKIELSIREENGIVYCRRKIFTPAGKLEDEMMYPPKGGVYGIAPNPENKEWMIKDEGDLEKFKYLLADPFKFSSPYEKVKKDFGDKTLIGIRACNGCDHFFVNSIGLGNAMVAYFEKPELFKKLLKICADFNYRCIERALDYKPDIIMDSWFNCSLSAGWSPAIWREHFFPYIKADRELVRKAGVYYSFYDDGKIMDILPELKELSPDILSTLCPPPVGNVDLRTVKKELGDKVCLNGFIDLQTIYRGTPEQVENEVKNAIEIAGPGGGYWLGTSDSIREGSPLENMKAYFKATRKYGKY